ncbi:Sporulation-specific protease YabG [Caloramator mitchellensis]|uniref:Sporulation-specific protease YabG n=1 Tax=Caloramator mitchellensis TaxID=908809 RepID=A0A0R3JW50_CALMK|nr:sporulation peptidase YabG [Caloramator mitchellensis]KRQ87783.1 Sporulation-specific protease YabG [Caloramator mitchellensis]
MSLKVGDIVARKSYGGDVYFKIMQIITKSDGKRTYVLKGIELRIVADAPEEDLMQIDSRKLNEYDEVFNKKVNAKIKKIILSRKSPFHGKRFEGKEKEFSQGGRSGRVLHIDGDEEYMNICLKGYKQLGINVIVKYVPEVQQSDIILQLLKEYKPDILVLTGHDSIVKGAKNLQDINNYRNSRFFVEAVKKAREYEPGYDDLVIFAGACQSYYEALLDAGANFASSPGRVLIHAMDPVFVCEKIAFSSISKFLSPNEVLQNTITGDKGIGGLETRGKYRECSHKV